MSELDEFSARLGRVVAQRIGLPGEVSEVRRLTGGATKATYDFRARINDEVRHFVLQISNPRAVRAGDPLGQLPRVVGGDDAALMMAAASSGVPVPEVKAVLVPEDGLGQGFITRFVGGETIARRLLREPEFANLRQGFAAQCGRILARIHAMEGTRLPFLQPFGAARQVALYRAAYESFDAPQPVIELGLRWAEDHLPENERRTVQHGDFRMGNLICDAHRIASVLDWELAAFGDPMGDLGWLMIRTWRFGGAHPVGGIGTREDLFAAYEQESGHRVPRKAVRFWEGFGCIKWAIMCLMKGEEHRRTGTRTVEAFAIGRRMEEPLYDFLDLLAEGD
ncbi:MAG TPA: phosphotransferase family protein [Stellaceae bacterium]|nr:phosphotransferase family protein [Stellaceae bacterium]